MNIYLVNSRGMSRKYHKEEIVRYVKNIIRNNNTFDEKKKIKKNM